MLVRRPRHRLFALLSVRDGMRYLPGYVANVSPHVDGIIAVDDASSDGSAEFLADSERVVELIRYREDGRVGEMVRHRALVEAALRHGGDWAFALDADERLERSFRARAERVIARGRLLGLMAFSFRVRELWDAHDRYRTDGIWGRKRSARLFVLRADHVYDTAPLHGQKAPLQATPVRLADLNVYHLGMLTAEDRSARRTRYETLDPDHRWQQIGYAYLTDPTGLRLAGVPRRRGWLE
jgi:hypothetical protein